MTHVDQAEHVTVLDSEGMRGTARVHALRQADAQVLVTFGEEQRVQVPAEMLHEREDGSYFLPLSLRELSDGTVALQRTAGGQMDNTIVAVIPVVVEEAKVTKHEVETGRVRIHKTVQSAEEHVDVPLVRDQVQVERVPVERYLEQPAAPHYRGDTLVIPVMEEVLVVQKRLLLREEIHVTTVRVQVQHQEAVTLQREHVSVTRDESGSDDPSSAA